MVWNALNEKILKIWEDHISGDDEDALAPLFYPDHGPIELLFVGFNPSFNIRETQARAPADINVSEYYRWQGFSRDRIQVMQKIQLKFVDSFAYFRPMEKIAVQAGLKWAHLDLYPFRNTNQDETIRRINLNNALRNTLDQLFNETVWLLKPKIILVANAYASQCFKMLFKDDLRFDEAAGYHLLDMDSKPTAVFFSGMLTGQRALDSGSLERLRWHVRKAAEALRSAKSANAVDRRGHMGWGPGDIEILD